jgi:DNA-damage-inducible protein J
MNKIATVKARVEPSLKAEVDTVFKKLGLTTSEAINLFYRQIQLRQGLSFLVKIPNEETLQVFQDTDNGKNLNSYGSIDEMFESLDKC